MNQVVLKAENISKQYRLGQMGSGTISHDINRWWHKTRGKEDPYLKLGDANDRSKAGGSDYVWSLKDINFEITEGEVLGIVGKNGAGKSTLLKILSQVTTPTTGEVKVKGRIAALLEVGTGFHPDLTGRENVFLNGAILGMSKAEIKSKLDEIIDFSGVAKYIDTPVKRYSSGMMVRLGFSVAAHLEPEILIVDEVLAVGDADFQKKCLGKMKDVSGQGRTIIFVSHNMAAINNLCSRVIFLENGQLKMDGKTSDVINYYLKGNTKDLSFGVIPDSFPRNMYHKNVLRINSIFVKNTNDENQDVFRYMEPLTVEFEIESQKLVENAVVIVSIMHDDYGTVTYSATNDPYNQTKIIIKNGKQILVAKIEQNMLPGIYSIGVGILDDKGYSYDYISHFGNLKIENFTSDKIIYPWTRSIGMINTKSQILIK